MSTSAQTVAFAPPPPLPFGHTPAGAVAPASSMNPQAVVGFDALLHEINPDAARVDQTRLQALTQWLASLPPEAAHDVLDLRMHRIELLRTMLADPDWDTNPALRVRIEKLLAYIDLDYDVLADSTPVVGLLDDVLLLELSWPLLEAEADEYRDFCAYRDSEHPDGNGDQKRAAWMCDRLVELAWLRHEASIRDGHYLDVAAPSKVFRVA